MARYVLPIPSLSRRGIPYWMDRLIEQGHQFYVSNETAFGCVGAGKMVHLSVKDSYWPYLPLAGDLTKNECEVLIKLEKLTTATSNFTNTGGAISFGTSPGVGASEGYLCSMGSNGRFEVIYRRDPIVPTQTQLVSVSTTPGYTSTLTVPYFLRARKSGGLITMKAWDATNPEPEAWHATATDTTHDTVTAGLILHGYGLCFIVHGIAIADGGDTATFDIPTTEHYGGVESPAMPGDVVTIRAVKDHGIIQDAPVASTGVWDARFYTDEPVYARVERVDGSAYDFYQTRFGDGYLGGDFPLGAVSVEGSPGVATIQARLRSTDPTLDGCLMAEVQASPAGTWKLPGLQRGVPYDVFAKHPDYKDQVVPKAEAVEDPDTTFTVLGGVSVTNGVLAANLVVKGVSSLPIAASLTGEIPYGLSAADFTVTDRNIRLNHVLRDHGDVGFNVDLVDSEGRPASVPVAIADADRGAFVDMVASFVMIDYSGNKNFSIPAAVQPGDLMILAVSRRMAITITDNSGSPWVLVREQNGLPIYDQTLSFYQRRAIAGDANRSITVARVGSSDSHLLTNLSIYRGRFALLQVAASGVGDLRYDDTYNKLTMNLKPIQHAARHLIRGIGQVYQLATNSVLLFNGLNNIGPTAGAGLRLQVGHGRLSKPGTLEMTARTSSESDLKINLDVWLLLDEIR